MKSGILHQVFLTVFLIKIVSSEPRALVIYPSAEGQEAYKRFATDRQNGQFESPVETYKVVYPSAEGQEAYKRFATDRQNGRFESPVEAYASSGSRLRASGNTQEKVKSELPQTDQVIFGAILPPQKTFNSRDDEEISTRATSPVHYHDEYEIANLQLPVPPSHSEKNEQKISISNLQLPPAGQTGTLEHDVPNLKLPGSEPEISTRGGIESGSPKIPMRHYNRVQIPLAIPVASATTSPAPEVHYHDEYEIANLELPKGAANSPEAVRYEKKAEAPPAHVHFQPTTEKHRPVISDHKVYEIPNLAPPSVPSREKDSRKPSNVYLAPDTPLPIHRIPGTRYTAEHEPPKAIPYSEYKEVETSRSVSSSRFRFPTTSPQHAMNSLENTIIPSPRVASPQRFAVSAPPLISDTRGYTIAPPAYASPTTPRSIYGSTTTPPHLYDFPTASGSPPPDTASESASSEESSVPSGKQDPAPLLVPAPQIRHIITYVLPASSYAGPLGLDPQHQQLKSEIESSIRDLFQPPCTTSSCPSVSYAQPLSPATYKRVYTTQYVK